MTTTTPSAALVPDRPVFSDAEWLALAGFLAGYRGLTREAYTLDLRQFTGWCQARSLSLFSARRADIEAFARVWKPAAGSRTPGSRGGHIGVLIRSAIVLYAPSAPLGSPQRASPLALKTGRPVTVR